MAFRLPYTRNPMYSTKPTNSLRLIHIAQLDQQEEITTEPGTFNIYLFDSSCPNGEACLQLHESARNKRSSQLPALQGYHVCLREELILMLGCDHITPFDLSWVHGNHLILTSAPDIFVKLVTLIQKIPCTCDLGNSVLKTRLVSLVKWFVIQIARQHRKFQQVPSVRRPSYEDLTMRFVKLIDLEINHRRSACEYAKLLSVSRGILDQALQTTTGYTANRFIHKTLVYKAKQAAIHSNASMKETAYNLGFNDIAHFSKFFRQNAGMTFSTFKQTFQNG